MWKCPKCECNNIAFSDTCVYCRLRLGIATSAPENAKYQYDIMDEDIYRIRIWQLDVLCRHTQHEINQFEAIRHGKAKPVTPQEELFASFFNNEKETIASMSIIELRAHREELSKIAFEARARLTAVDDEERTRKAKNANVPNRGFSTSVVPDELATDAINKVKKRQARMSKEEKLRESMIQLQIAAGHDKAEAEKIVNEMMSAGALLNRLRSREDKDKVIGVPAEKAIKIPEVTKPVVNPFEVKKEETKTEVTIQEETNTIIIHETVTEVKTEEKKSFNPFIK